MSTASPEPLPRKKWHLRRWLALLALALAAYFGWKAYDFRAAIKEAKALEWDMEYTDPFDTIQKDWKATFKKQTWHDAVPNVGIPTDEELVQHRKLLLRLNPKALHIHSAPTLGDLTALNGLTRLEELLISSAPSLTNVDALKNHAALKSVWIDDCTALTNMDALRHLTALKWVSLLGCTSLTNVDALKNLTALETVGLDGCTGLTNVDALKHLTALEEVGLSSCTSLTNVDALINLPALKTVVLVGCTSLSAEAITALKAALPNATIIGP